MNTLVIDPFCGMAGDMFCAALMDLGAEKQSTSSVMRRAAEVLGGGQITVRSETRFGTKGTMLSCEYPAQAPSTESAQLKQTLHDVCVEFGIGGAYREYALRAYSVLEQAEQAAHEKIERHPHPQHHHHHVHLHEAQDIIVDIAGSVWALQELEVAVRQVSCLAPVATGGGEVRFSHGTFAVPAPAVAEIISRYRIPVHPGPFQSELLTPTGAALLAAFSPNFTERDRQEPPSGIKPLVGVGFGNKRFPRQAGKRANALYLFLWAGAND
ncbi:MAG: DUF111 family protein [Spirochaetia bacterium]